jgi:serine/threonine protein phosphatase PrpC
MRALQGYVFETDDAAARAMLQKFSVAAVFDGHNGAACSEYLLQYLTPRLVTHPAFLGSSAKQLEVALHETFEELDVEVSEQPKRINQSTNQSINQSIKPLALYCNMFLSLSHFAFIFL